MHTMKVLTTRIAAAIVASPVVAQIESKVDHLSGSSNHYLLIESDTTVSNSIGRPKTASIIVRCVKGKFETYINTPTYNGVSRYSSKPVATKWDNGPVTSGIWSTSSDGDAFFHSKPRSFHNELTSHSTFVFGWEPYGKTQVSAKWNLKPHQKDLTEIARLCGVSA